MSKHMCVHDENFIISICINFYKYSKLIHINIFIILYFYGHIYVHNKIFEALDLYESINI